MGVDVIGVNCSGGPVQLLRILKLMKQTLPEAYFSVMPNAGFPKGSADGLCTRPAGILPGVCLFILAGRCDGDRRVLRHDT